MLDVLPLPKARVPIVKFVFPDTGTKVSILFSVFLFDFRLFLGEK